MSESTEAHSLLPKVTEDDLLTLGLHELIDPDYQKIWHDFSHDNPELARALLKRAYLISGGSPEAQQRILSQATFVIAALQVALAREHRASQQEQAA